MLTARRRFTSQETVRMDGGKRSINNSRGRK